MLAVAHCGQLKDWLSSFLQAAIAATQYKLNQHIQEGRDNQCFREVSFSRDSCKLFTTDPVSSGGFSLIFFLHRDGPAALRPRSWPLAHGALAVRPCNP